jgi:hypothetical protein
MNICDVVDKLVGPVEPVGCSQSDSERMENLETLINLSDHILIRINDCSKSKGSYESSVKQIGLKAEKHLSDLIDNYDLDARNDDE